MAVMDAEDTVIADGDPVSISAEVLKDTLNPIEGRLAINDPFFAIELSSELFKTPGLLEMADTVWEFKIAFGR